MNEWDLQHLLTQRWRNGENLIFRNKKFSLICWELMFPSWEINDNKTKWNEPSIDFIFFDNEQTFLCVELKNHIKNRKEFLSAYCQVIHRSAEFIKGYSPAKMLSARKACFKTAKDLRGGNQQIVSDGIIFPENPFAERIIAAVSFPVRADEMLDELNSKSVEEIKTMISAYSLNREFEKFIAINEATMNGVDIIKVAVNA